MESGFYTKLVELLKQYNASISFNVSEYSDTYGLSEERMVLSCIENGSEKNIEIYGWEFDYKDLENEL